MACMHVAEMRLKFVSLGGRGRMGQVYEEGHVSAAGPNKVPCVPCMCTMVLQLQPARGRAGWHGHKQLQSGAAEACHIAHALHAVLRSARNPKPEVGLVAFASNKMCALNRQRLHAHPPRASQRLRCLPPLRVCRRPIC